MTEQATSIQSNSYPLPKTFTSYIQAAKTFQPYVPPTIVTSNISNSLSKNNEIKNHFSLGTNSTLNGHGLSSPKVQSTQFKTIPSFLQNRNVMKNSMIHPQHEASPAKQLKTQIFPISQQNYANIKKAPRMSQHPDMKLSSIELGTQGYKIPSFLNKQKKIPYTSTNQRPQSSKDLLNPKDNKDNNGISSDPVLNSSYGNLKKKGSDFVEVGKDPTQEWVKTSLPKKKQKIFTINDFEQIKQLGTGKYGKVYLVREKQTNFICAIKILQKSLIKQQEITEQIIRQLKIQTFINHANVIKMYGFFDDSVYIYLIMQLATGGQLFKHLKKHQLMPQTRVASIIKQICQALEQLHSNRIIHRDIKPQNIVLSGNVIKLCDFGWSVYCDSNLRTTFCGTPLYVGPQILKGKQYDDKIDVWSLGIMMYQMLVGQNPFKITKQQELIKIIKDEIIIPKYVELSQEARNFMFSCLQKNPNQRLSIRELLNHEFFKKFPQKNDKKLNI